MNGTSLESKTLLWSSDRIQKRTTPPWTGYRPAEFRDIQDVQGEEDRDPISSKNHPYASSEGVKVTPGRDMASYIKTF